MFVQVIRGKTDNPQGVREALDRWVRELAPDATGWLGSTTGVTADGDLIAIVRFQAESDARRNSDRPEQGEWWSEMSKLLSGDAVFEETDTAFSDLHGNPDNAGFVQIMQGRTTDADRVEQLMASNRDARARFRPDVIGMFTAVFDGGRYTTAIYFTSEEEARSGEGSEPPEELRVQMQELGSLMDGVPEFFDLSDAWMVSPD